MTLSTTTSRIEYVGNGVTTTFSFPYYFLSSSDLAVYQGTTLKTLTTHYTVTGAGSPSGGSVVFVTAPAVDDTVVILRDPALTQATDYTPNDAFPASSHETALDRIVMGLQRLRSQITRAVRQPDSAVGTVDLTLPATLTPDSFLMINGDGNGLSLGAQESYAGAVQYVQSGTGAVSRLAQAKAREWISYADFGAVGDGVTDDSAAIALAVAYATSLNDGITSEGSAIEVRGIGLSGNTFALGSTVTLEGEGLTYSGGTYYAIDGTWDDTPLIVLASGQSNMRGNPGSTGGTFPSNTQVYAWLATVSGGAGSWIQNPDFENVTYYVAGSTVSLGGGVNCPALAFAHRLQEASNRPIRLVIECKGNQNISEWIDLGTSSARYAALKTQLEAALAAISSTADVDVFLWQQGENNSADTANQYETKLGSLFTLLEAEAWWSVANTAVILGELFDGNAAYDENTTGIHQYWLDNPGMTMWAESAGLTDAGDTIHFDGASLFELGYRRYFDALQRTEKAWCSPLIEIASPSVKLSNAIVFSNRKCAGVLSSSSAVNIEGCEIISALCYSARLDAGDTWVRNCLMTGLRNGDALFSDQDNWTARGLWNHHVDNKIVNNIIRWHSINFFHDYQAGTCLFSGNHTYAGGSGHLVVDNPRNMDLRSGGIVVTGCYIDNGRVDIFDHNVRISNVVLLCSASDVSLDQMFGIFAMGDSQPYWIWVTDVVAVSSTLTNGTVPIVQFLPYASQTWGPNYTKANALAPYDVRVVGRHTVISNSSNIAVMRFVSGNSSSYGAALELADADTTDVDDPPLMRSSGDGLRLKAKGSGDVRLEAGGGDEVFVEAGGLRPIAAGTMSLGKTTNRWASGYINDIVQSGVTTGGTGSAGAGKQYVTMKINGTTYKLLYDT
jgi:hypothetical protein